MVERRTYLPSPLQLVLQALLWSVVAWLVAAGWTMKAQSAEIGAALSHYYAVRAPVVGAIAGVLWAPLTLVGNLPGRARSTLGNTLLTVLPVQGHFASILQSVTATNSLMNQRSWRSPMAVGS